MSPSTLAVAEQFVRDLAARGWTLSVGESCTGGLVSATVSHCAGVSAVFTHGFACYSNMAKMDILGVEQAVMEQHGAVSEAVAVQMAEGAAAAGRTDVGLGLTGIAGPGGGTALKPVGLVYGAVCIRGTTQTKQWQILGGRQDVREGSVKALMTFAARVLLEGDGLRRF